MVVLLAGCRLEPNPSFDEALGAPTAGDGTTAMTNGSTGSAGSMGSTGTGSSGSDNTGDGPSSSGVDSTSGVGEGCYDGVAAPGALCFEYRLVTAGAGQDALSVAAGDFDGDGNADILVGNFGAVRVLFGDGTGSFWGEFTLAPSAQAGFASPVDAGALDLDDDGLDDAVMVWAESNTVDVLLASAEGGFEPPVPHAIDGSPSRVVAADFDDDGNVDLAVSSVTGNAVTILYGLGGGSFEPSGPMAACSCSSTPVTACSQRRAHSSCRRRSP
jgi:FG-GAP-like repeat